MSDKIIVSHRFEDCLLIGNQDRLDEIALEDSLRRDVAAGHVAHRVLDADTVLDPADFDLSLFRRHGETVVVDLRGSRLEGTVRQPDLRQFVVLLRRSDVDGVGRQILTRRAVAEIHLSRILVAEELILVGLGKEFAPARRDLVGEFLGHFSVGGIVGILVDFGGFGRLFEFRLLFVGGNGKNDRSEQSQNDKQKSYQSVFHTFLLPYVRPLISMTMLETN